MKVELFHGAQNWTDPPRALLGEHCPERPGQTRQGHVDVMCRAARHTGHVPSHPAHLLPCTTRSLFSGLSRCPALAHLVCSDPCSLP